LFTDNQPWLANSIKFISQNVVNISGYTVGIMNFLMLVSILVAALLIYVLLHRLKLPPWYTFLVATGVALFSPQLTRMGGHYALAYCWVVPLILVLAHWFHTKPSWRKSTIIGLVIFLIAGLHFYFFALGAFFLALFFFFRWVFQPSVKSLWQSGAHFGLQVVLPFVLFSLWLNLTDDVTDRPTDPFGFLVYKSTLKSAFLPIDFPHGKFLPDLLGFRMEEIAWESVAYIGLAADIGLLILIGFGFMQLVKRNYWSWLRPLQHDFLDPMFSAGVFLFAFSLGVPFIFGLESLVEYLGPLKQFRGIGRFSWIFFYVMQVMAFYVFYTRFFKDKTSGLRWLAIGLPLLVLMTEAWMFDTKPKYGLNTIPELEQLQGEDHWLRNVNVDDYQALIPLPYNHTGSENFWISDKESDVVKKSMIMSLQSGLPMTSVLMSRTSFSQTWQNLRLKWEPLEAAFPLLDHL
ncbi:MAG: hypothetical protein AAGB22_12370, partial [Bacteroidota bacterium]